jgi:hypothetical protein
MPGCSSGGEEEGAWRVSSRLPATSSRLTQCAETVWTVGCIKFGPRYEILRFAARTDFTHPTGAVPRRRLAQRGDELLLNPHTDRDVRRRVLVPAPGVARDDPRDLGQSATPQVVEEAALRAERALVVRPALPEDKDVVGVAVGDAVPADVVDLPGHAGRLEQVEDDRVAHVDHPDRIGLHRVAGIHRDLLRARSKCFVRGLRTSQPFWVLDVAAALLSVRRERRQIPRAAETCAVVDVDGQLAVRRDSDK